jgi:hypothetical protein
VEGKYNFRFKDDRLKIMSEAIKSLQMLFRNPKCSIMNIPKEYDAFH